MSQSKPLELWGGVECTVVRIGEQFRSELDETGHLRRDDDLDAVADLGIKTLRYPVLWELVAPDHPDECRWEWFDRRFERLRELNIKPIVGLVHHGSGPQYTSLVDPNFPELLARHAERVAQRFPWVEMFTPVNEPLTTARFSGLYGHWYPHACDDRVFLRALVIQCRAVVLAMRAIRRFTPKARLIQTEDLGRTFSTVALRPQADFENDRRWLTFDLLCGRVDRHHPWRGLLTANGISEAELDFFLEADAAPDVLGINHYLTSDRYLDEQLERYPECFHGGSTIGRYADVEAVRVDLPEASLGPKARLAEAWERYRRPLAVTEAHHGCTRDEQIRWLAEVWEAAQSLRAAGQDIRAVTLWSLFGAVDWNSLLVRRTRFYEPGAFDIRAPRPRKTALAVAATALASNRAFDHPVLDAKGWWRREQRYYHPLSRKRRHGRRPPRKLMITGATGSLGQGLARICSHRGLEHVLLSRAQLDIADAHSVAEAFDRFRPWAVVNAAGYTRDNETACAKELCFRVHAQGAEVLARACSRLGLPLVTFSSERVFDGRLGRPYIERDATSPQCIYGESKADGEKRVAQVHPDALIVRTSALFGPSECRSFVYRALRDVMACRPVQGAFDSIVSPTYVPDLAHAMLDLLIDGESGIWHLTNDGTTSWRELAERLADHVGLRCKTLFHEEGAARVHALSTERGRIMPAFDCALSRYFNDCEVSWTEEAHVIAAE